MSQAVIKQGSITLSEGVHYTLDTSTGILTTIGSPSASPDSWTGEFDVCCRFNTDKLTLVAEDISFFRAQTIELMEVRPETFKNVRFPTTISYGAGGGPSFNTDVIILDSGSEQRNANWSLARCSYDVAKACKTDADRAALIAFFRVVLGMAYSFRFKDFTDYQVASGEGVLSSLGGGTYQLYKRYTNAGGTHDRPIYLPL